MHGLYTSEAGNAHNTSVVTIYEYYVYSILYGTRCAVLYYEVHGGRCCGAYTPGDHVPQIPIGMYAVPRTHERPVHSSGVAVFAPSMFFQKLTKS